MLPLRQRMYTQDHNAKANVHTVQIAVVLTVVRPVHISPMPRMATHMPNAVSRVNVSSGMVFKPPESFRVQSTLGGAPIR